MTMTLGQLKDRILSIIGGTFDADIERHINHAILQLSTVSEILRRADATMSDGSIAIPDDCMVLKDLYIGGQYIPRYSGTDIPPGGTAQGAVYTIDFDKNKIITNSTSRNGTVQLVYRTRENVLEQDTDTHSLQDADEYIIAFATWKALVERDGLSDEAMFWKNEAETEKRAWLRRNSEQGSRGRFVRLRPFI